MDILLQLFYAIETIQLCYGVFGCINCAYAAMLCSHAMHALKQSLYRKTEGKEPDIRCLYSSENYKYICIHTCTVIKDKRSKQPCPARRYPVIYASNQKARHNQLTDAKSTSI